MPLRGVPTPGHGKGEGPARYKFCEAGRSRLWEGTERSVAKWSPRGGKLPTSSKVLRLFVSFAGQKWGRGARQHIINHVCRANQGVQRPANAGNWGRCDEKGLIFPDNCLIERKTGKIPWSTSHLPQQGTVSSGNSGFSTDEPKMHNLFRAGCDSFCIFVELWVRVSLIWIWQRSWQL